MGGSTLCFSIRFGRWVFLSGITARRCDVRVVGASLRTRCGEGVASLVRADLCRRGASLGGPGSSACLVAFCSRTPQLHRRVGDREGALGFSDVTRAPGTFGHGDSSVHLHEERVVGVGRSVASDAPKLGLRPLKMTWGFG